MTDKMPCHITDEHLYNPWDEEDVPCRRQEDIEEEDEE